MCVVYIPPHTNIVNFLLKFDEYSLCVVYLPPHTNIVNFLLKFDEYLLSLTNVFSYNSSQIIYGDFYIDLLKVGSSSEVAEFTDLIYSNSSFYQKCEL